MNPNYSYNDLFERNLGIVTKKEQSILKHATVVVFGAGGLGGIICEILVRSGIENLKIVDNDSFDPSNINRQIFAFNHTIGKEKITITKDFLLQINPGVHIEIFNSIHEKNIGNICNNAEIGVLALDDAFPCIIISRFLRNKDIPLVEGWALPFANVRVFTSDTPSLEEVYEFPTKYKQIQDISEDEKKELNIKMLLNIRKIKGINTFLTDSVIDKIQTGKNPSFAPLVWLTAALMSFETIKNILGWDMPALAPDFFLYDPYKNSIPNQIRYENN